jgi:hypothetical protein
MSCGSSFSGGGATAPLRLAIGEASLRLPPPAGERGLLLAEAAPASSTRGDSFPESIELLLMGLLGGTTSGEGAGRVRGCVGEADFAGIGFSV